MKQLLLGELIIDVVHKDIKNIHLSVYPPNGKVRIAAPLRMDLDTVRVYAISKLDWIRKQKEKFINQDREAPREYLNRESHYFRGKRYLLQICETNTASRVELMHSRIILYARSNAAPEKLQGILETWYRAELKVLVAELIEKWEKILQVSVEEFGVKKMKTKWGTCNPEARRIWINLELVKKPPECLEYIVVHEMVHLLERNHNDHFIAYMDQFLPNWRSLKELLNKLPVKQESWQYLN
ncbi:SprT family zinc-dependent metalloprotease [Paenibacillus sp. ATY16]|uniref:M48 family metallopeptidase n=1 Tax=Paenibacillus sp. ATY16 TaxID=1759312 RepID=UPI00200FC945|nr:SprT family zinc-dependent metalloprotease [Paenibacillus sp. ATY16]MCK9858315.1 M48 family metallopeptidase [Paenibacillus sp. ATY16]